MKHKKETPEAKARHKLIREAFSPLGESIAESMADELEVKGGLLTPRKSYIKHKTDEITQSIDAELLKREQRMKKAGEIIKGKLSSLAPAEKERVERELRHSAESITSLLTPSENSEGMTEDKTMQSILGISNETLLWIYSIGYELSLAKHHEEALCIFQTLTTLNPLVADYFVAEGLAERALHHNKEALNSFAMASLMNPNQAISRYNSAELYLEQHQAEDASLELEVLEEIIAAGNLTDLKPAAESLRSRIQFSKAS